ncbi:MAG: hypothetical protein A3G76_07375, partial [Acidobacteria bacterium RIFCSPLOWO2_12_FULL_65_11]
RVAAVAETVNVIAGAPLISTMVSSVGEVVDLQRIERLPLNGRQFASLAATVPGVGLGFLTDPTKQGASLAPQINGGNGRNINFVVDGGDNNDDTVGGQLQQFPLEAIQEFNVQTQRFKAEFGRTNGGVMNVVTKSGTNMYAGSFFELLRDRSLNALTRTEKLAAPAGQNPAKSSYLRNQFGGSFGGPIVRDRIHFFVAYERTQEDRKQTMSTAVLSLFPQTPTSAPVEFRENVGTGKVSVNLNADHHLTFRYSRNTNSFPYGATSTATPDSWATGKNIFDSINLNHNWVLGGSRLNELILQYSDFQNRIDASPSAGNAFLQFTNGVQTGYNPAAPQRTDQHKFQVRDDFSWHMTGLAGLGHDFKTGFSFIYQPHLLAIAETQRGVVQYIMAAGAPACGCSTTAANVTQVFVLDGTARANLPNNQYGLYFQDDWRASDRLTLNLGVRYDLVTGLDIDQSKNPNFVKVQQAAQAGAFNGLSAPVAAALNRFAESPQSDRDNIQPRLGAVYDLRGNGRDIIRGGWGIYHDFGYTNAGILPPAIAASGTFGFAFAAVSGGGLTNNTDGSFYQVGQPLSNLTNLVAGTNSVFGFWADPRLEQPYQIQTNVGWDHELTPNTRVSADYVNSLGRDLNYRPRLNQDLDPSGVTARQISTALVAAGFTALNPNNSSNRPALSVGQSRYNALMLSMRRRMSQGVDVSASYTLSESLSTIGAASDELNTANIQDPRNPFDDPRQMGPNQLTDARHRFTLSAVIEAPYGVRVAPIFFYRSALPVPLRDGRDLNADGDPFDIPARAFAVDSVDPDTGTATIKDIGACETVNCGRSQPQSQFNLRVSRVFRVANRVNIEAIGEIYNLFNALNPATSNATVNNAAGVQLPTLLQPTSYSGDIGRPEQRLGQIGFRVTF